MPSACTETDPAESDARAPPPGSCTVEASSIVAHQPATPGRVGMTDQPGGGAWEGASVLTRYIVRTVSPDYSHRSEIQSSAEVGQRSRAKHDRWICGVALLFAIAVSACGT